MNRAVRTVWWDCVRRGRTLYVLAFLCSTMAGTITLLDGRLVAALTALPAALWLCASLAYFRLSAPVLRTLPVSARDMGRAAWWSACGGCIVVTLTGSMLPLVVAAVLDWRSSSSPQVLQWVGATFGLSVAPLVMLLPTEDVHLRAPAGAARIVEELTFAAARVGAVLIGLLLFGQGGIALLTTLIGCALFVAVATYLRPQLIALPRLSLFGVPRRSDSKTRDLARWQQAKAAAVDALRPRQILLVVALVLYFGYGSSGVSLWVVALVLLALLCDLLLPRHNLWLLTVVVVAAYLLLPHGLGTEPVTSPAVWSGWRTSLVVLLGTIAFAVGFTWATERAMALRTLRTLPLSAHRIALMLIGRASGPVAIVGMLALIVNTATAFAPSLVMLAAVVHVIAAQAVWPAWAVTAQQSRPWLRVLVILGIVFWIVVGAAVIILARQPAIALSAPLVAGLAYWWAHTGISRSSAPYQQHTAEFLLASQWLRHEI